MPSPAYLIAFRPTVSPRFTYVTVHNGHMSKGLGRLQRWLVANLPAHDGDHPVTAAELAVAFYDTDTPTINQRTTVLRSLHSLHQRGLVIRWPPQTHQRGKPLSWSRRPTDDAGDGSVA